MRLITPSGTLDTQKDIAIEMSFSHPFYSEEGSASIPFNLPASRNNCDLLGCPDDFKRAFRFVKLVDCVVSSNIFSLKGILTVDAVNGGNNISTSFCIDESEVYAQLQNSRLKDLFAGEVLVNVKNLDAISIETAYLGDAEGLAVFPVASDFEDGNVFIINSPDNFRSPSRTEIINGETITVPAGYGQSTYLFLWKLIEKAFTLAGITVGTNIFKTDSILRNIVVLNSLADTFTRLGGGFDFYYSDIVPDITVGDLIVWLHDKFGAIVSYRNQTVNVELFRDIISAGPDMELSDFRNGEDSISYPAPSALKLEADTSLEQASPAAGSLPELRNKFDNCAECMSYNDIAGTGLFKVIRAGRYYSRDASGVTTFLGSDAFPYIRTSDGDESVIAADDPFVPMLEIDGKFYPYVGKRRHAHISGAESADGQPMMICYAFLDGHYCGSTYPYNEKGTAQTGFPALTPEGLAATYWRDHEKCLINGAPEIDATLEMPLTSLLSMNPITPKRYYGSNVIIKSMEYVLSDLPKSTVKVTFQLLPTYTDAVVHEPIVFNTSLVWEREEDWPYMPSFGFPTREESDDIDDYTSNDKPAAPPRRVGEIAKRRQRSLYIYNEEDGGFPFIIHYYEYFIAKQS